LLVNLPSPHPGSSTHPSTSEVLQAREHTPTPFSYVVVTFGLAIESIKELGGASHKFLIIIKKSLICLWGFEIMLMIQGFYAN